MKEVALFLVLAAWFGIYQIATFHDDVNKGVNDRLKKLEGFDITTAKPLTKGELARAQNETKRELINFQCQMIAMQTTSLVMASIVTGQAND